MLGKTLGNDNLWFTTVGGIQPALNPAPGLAALFEQFAQGQLLFVPASETPALIARKSPPGQPLLDGVAFNTITPQVVAAIVRLEPDSPPALNPRAPCVPPNCSPSLKGNEGIVLSGTLHDLLVVGGTSDGTENGSPATAAWLLDVDHNAWEELSLPVGGRPGHVRAAVYRQHDMKTYLVERKDAKTRLVRYLPRDPVEVLGALDEDWDFPLSYLAVGDGGDLVFAGSAVPTGNEDHVLMCHAKNAKLHTLSVAPEAVPGHVALGDTLGPCLGSIGDDPGPKSSLLARFQVTHSGKVVFLGSKHLVTPLLGRPLVTADAVLVPVPSGKLARLRHVPFDELALAGEEHRSDEDNNGEGRNGDGDEHGKGNGKKKNDD